MATNFPGTGIDSFGAKVDNVTNVAAADVNNLQDSIVALETKVGVDSSATVTSVDYLVKNAASIDPGHKHTTATLSAFAGAVTMYAGASVPTGWLICDGASLLRASYPDLFTAIGTTYGYADGSHFNVPDFRGVFPKGAGTTSRTLGKDANGNFYTATLGTYATDKMQGHTHVQSGRYLAQTGGGSYNWGAGGGSDSLTLLALGGPSTDGSNGTPRTGMTTEPQNVGINFIIKT